MKKHSLSNSITIFFVLSAGFFSVSCRPNDTTGSNVQYLTERDYQCHPFSQDMMDKQKAKFPSGFVSGFNGSEEQVVVNRLTGIPTPYMDELITNFSSNKFSGISSTFTLGFAAGVTTLSGGIARSIVISSGQAGFALQHEVGHAVEHQAQEKAPQVGLNFGTEMAASFNEIKSSGAGIRSYAKSAEGEAFAEAFANYYCSEETHNFIATNLPKTYQFLSKVLEAPLFKEVNNVTATPQDQNNDTPAEEDGPVESDIKLALTDGKNPKKDIALQFATSPDIASLVVCKEDSDSCAGDGSNDLIFEINGEKKTTKNRRFYPSKSLDTKIFGTEWTVVGYDEAGEVVTTRKIEVDYEE